MTESPLTPEPSAWESNQADGAVGTAVQSSTREQADTSLVIAMVCPYDLSVVGGVQSHVFDVVTQMVRRGHKVSVLAPVSDPAAVAVRVGAWPQWLTNAGRARSFAINGSKAPVRVSMGQRRQIHRWLRQVSPDVVHVHEPFVPALSMPTVFAARSLRRADGRRLPVVGTFHASVDSSTLLRLVAPLLRVTARRLTRCIAVSAMAEQTLRHVHVSTPVRIIANPVDTARFARAVVDKPSPAHEAGQVLFLGRGDEPRKGLPDLLSAWPLVRAARPHANLVVAGRVTPDDVLRVSGVDLLGPVSEDEKPGLYAGVDVYVAPQRGGESMGLVLVEAMAAGTAVVATDLPAFRAVAVDGAAAALVPPRDPVALANAILAVLDDRPYRESLIAAGQQRAGDFDVITVLDQIEAVYRSV